jgi:hypothetical protein
LSGISVSANRQRDVDFGVRADLQHDAVADVGVEALQDDLELIGSDRQVRDRVGPFCARENRARQTSIGLGDRHFGTRHAGVGRITHDAGQLRSCDLLRPCGAGRDEDEKHDANERSEHVHHRTSGCEGRFHDRGVSAFRRT